MVVYLTPLVAGMQRTWTEGRYDTHFLVMREGDL